MNIKELRRSIKQGGETVTEFEVGKLHIRLIGTYGGEKTLDELLYIIACNKLAGRLA
jgi:hypothetical protein